MCSGEGLEAEDGISTNIVIALAWKGLASEVSALKKSTSPLLALVVFVTAANS